MRRTTAEAKAFARRQAEATGLLELKRLRDRLADLEPALAENHRLEVRLEQQVAEVERLVGEVAHRWAEAAADYDGQEGVQGAD